MLVLVLLVLVLLVGHEVGGGKRWLRVASLSLQPSEFAKLSVVILLADYLDRRKSRLDDFWKGFFPPIVMVGSVLGLILLERDLGTPLLLASVSVGMMILAGVRPRHLVGLVLAILPIVAVSIFCTPYRRERLLTFLDPWGASQGVGYQLVQSLLALGSGGFLGQGPGESTIKMHYLPEAQTDFVFPIFGEEFGFLGTATLTCAFFYLTWRCFWVASHGTHWFSVMVAAGVSLLLGGQVLLNLGVVTGLLPTKGIPLPFISFGGSSLVVILTAIGLVLNVSRERGTPVLLQR
jgi:cell division protein FtsW